MSLFSIFAKRPTQQEIVWQMTFDRLMERGYSANQAADQADEAVRRFNTRPQ